MLLESTAQIIHRRILFGLHVPPLQQGEGILGSQSQCFCKTDLSPPCSGRWLNGLQNRPLIVNLDSVAWPHWPLQPLIEGL